MSPDENDATQGDRPEEEKPEEKDDEKKAAPKKEAETKAAPPKPVPTQGQPEVMRPSGEPEKPTLPAQPGALPEAKQPTGPDAAKEKPAAPAAKPTPPKKEEKKTAWPFPARHAEPNDTQDLDALAQILGDALEHRGMDATGKPVAYIKPDKIWDAANHAHAELKFDHLACLTAIDYLAEGKFDVTYNLYSYPRGRHLVLKALIPRSKPEIASVTSIWRGANWHEREVWDMFGIRFTGHPNLQRMFLPEGWRGHPLRKDYDLKEQFIGLDDETGDDLVFDEPGEYRW